MEWLNVCTCCVHVYYTRTSTHINTYECRFNLVVVIIIFPLISSTESQYAESFSTPHYTKLSTIPIAFYLSIAYMPFGRPSLDCNEIQLKTVHFCIECVRFLFCFVLFWILNHIHSRWTSTLSRILYLYLVTTSSHSTQSNKSHI